MKNFVSCRDKRLLQIVGKITEGSRNDLTLLQYIYHIKKLKKKKLIYVEFCIHFSLEAVQVYR